MKTIDKYIIKSAFVITMPVLLGYLAIGIAFGLLLVEAGFEWWLAPLMSLLIYAGAGQYIAVPMLAANARLADIAMVTLLVNARHMVYGLSLLDKFRGSKWCKPYLIFSLTDETYALLTSVDVPAGMPKNKFFFSIALLDHCYWIVGSTIGAVAGSFIAFNTAGLNFALTALFVVLLIEQIKRSHTPLPFIIAACASIMGFLIGGKSNMLIISLLLSIVTLLLFKRKLHDEKSA